MKTKIALDALPPSTDADILTSYDVLVGAMTASNNTLIGKMLAVPAVPIEVVAILNDWSRFVLELLKHQNAEVERLAASGTDRPRPGTRLN